MLIQTSTPIKRLSELDELERKLAIEKALALERAFNSKDVDTIYKAQDYYSKMLGNAERTRNQPLKSLIVDPQEVATSMGYYHKAANLSYEALRAMSRTPVIAAIIRTRKNQVKDFLKPQPDKYSRGFIIRKKGADKDDDLSDSDKKTIEKLTEFMLNCGEHEQKFKWDRLDTWGSKIVEDSLALDQAVFEVVPYRGGEPYAFAAVDGATFRFADRRDDRKKDQQSKQVNGEFPAYVQLYQGQIAREFYPWELCMGIRNASSNILANGYGRGELEDLITMVTAMLNADKYNSGFFRHGSAPKGILMIKKPGAAVNADRIAEFRRNWNAMLAGAENAHKTPILDAEGFEWIDLQKNNRDMEFFKYIEYLVKVACAVFTISPEEIGFTLEGSQGGSKLSNDSGKEEKEYSLDKGLKPLLTSIQQWINMYIIGPKTNDKYELVFAGLQVESAKEEEERLTKAATIYMEVNEVRKERGLKPKKEYDIILNPVLSQQRMMQQQNAMQQQQMDNDLDTQRQTREDEDFDNTNPFLDKADSPFVKNLREFIQQELVKAA